MVFAPEVKEAPIHHKVVRIFIQSSDCPYGKLDRNPLS